ncbi:MAG: DUF5684 domain-containing protein [Candidatus Gastranaerophilales bacterium]
MTSLFLFLLLPAAYILSIVGLWIIFEKANRQGWEALIPIHNTVTIIEIAGKPGWWIFLLFIPIVNIVLYIMVLNGISKRFEHGVGFTIGLLFLPFVFNLILAFGKSKYNENPEPCPSNVNNPQQPNYANTNNYPQSGYTNHTAPAYQQPVNASAPAYQQPVNTTTPVYQEPMNTTAPVYQQSMNATAPVYQEPVNAPAPMYQEPANTTAPAYQQPMNTTAPV